MRLLKLRIPRIKAIKFFRKLEFGESNINDFSIPEIRKKLLQLGVSENNTAKLTSKIYIQRVNQKAKNVN